MSISNLIQEENFLSWYENMTEIRKINEDTQINLAKKIGWSRPQIQRYEEGDYPTEAKETLKEYIKNHGEE